MDTFDGLLGLTGEDFEEFAIPPGESTVVEEPLTTVEQHGDRALLRALPTSRWTVAVPDVAADAVPDDADYADTVAEPYSGPVAHDRFDIEDEQASEAAIEEVGSIVPSLPSPVTDEEIGEPIDLETLRSFEAQVEASLYDERLDESDKAQEFGIDESPIPAVPESDYPRVLEADIARLERVAARGRTGKILAAISVGLIVVLGIQYAWFMPQDMASRYPQTRNFLTVFCRHTGCTLIEQRDPAQVQVVSRDVRVHPKFEGALLVTAQLVNVANFAQPYPLMEFTLV